MNIQLTAFKIDKTWQDYRRVSPKKPPTSACFGLPIHHPPAFLSSSAAAAAHRGILGLQRLCTFLRKKNTSSTVCRDGLVAARQISFVKRVFDERTFQVDSPNGPKKTKKERAVGPENFSRSNFHRATTTGWKLFIPMSWNLLLKLLQHPAACHEKPLEVLPQLEKSTKFVTSGLWDLKTFRPSHKWHKLHSCLAQKPEEGRPPQPQVIDPGAEQNPPARKAEAKPPSDRAPPARPPAKALLLFANLLHRRPKLLLLELGRNLISPSIWNWDQKNKPQKGRKGTFKWEVFMIIWKLQEDFTHGNAWLILGREPSSEARLLIVSIHTKSTRFCTCSICILLKEQINISLTRPIWYHHAGCFCVD